MADSENTVGTEVKAEGVNEFLSAMAGSKKALAELGETIDKLAKKDSSLEKLPAQVKDTGDKAKQSSTDLQGMADKLSGLPVVGPQIARISDLIGGIGGAGEAAGIAVSSGMAAAVVAIGAVAAAAALAVGALVAINSSVNNLATYAGGINDIQKVAGTSAQMSQQINASAQIAGVGVNTITMSYLQLNDGAQKAGEEATKALTSIGGAADQTAKQLARLNEDHARSVTETNQALTDKLADINAQMLANEQDFNKKRSDTAADYNKQISDGRARLKQQLDDLEESHAEKVSDLNQSLADEMESFDRERQDREQKLQDSLADVESKYGDKRDAINAKYYAPKSAREAAAKQEELALLDKQQASEEKKLKDAASKEEARDKADHDKKVSRLQQQLDSENAEYKKQTERLKAENSKRESDLRASYEKQQAATQEAYDKQVATSKKAQEQIKTDTAKRLADEQRQYERSLDDINTKTAGAAASAVKSVDPVTEAFKKLGISVAEWNSLSPDEQIKRLGTALEGIKDPVEKMNILSDIFGRRRAAEMLEFFEVFSQPHKLGLELSQDELNQLEQFQRDQREMDLQFQLLGFQIGQVFFPIWRDLLGGLKSFWAEHGPAINKAVKDVANFFAHDLVNAVKTVWNWLDTYIFPVFKAIASFLALVFIVSLGQLILKFDALFKGLKPVWEWLDKIFTKIGKDLTPAFIWLKDNVLTPLGKVFEDVGRAISTFFGNLVQAFKDTANSFPDWLKKLLGIEPTNFTVTYADQQSYNSNSGQYSGYAAGGIMMPGETAWVGEKGPELATVLTPTLITPPATASQIWNNYNASTSAMNSSSVTNINLGGITISGSGGYAAGRQAGHAFVDALKARGISIAGVN